MAAQAKTVDFEVDFEDGFAFVLLPSSCKPEDLAPYQKVE